ncbi:MAG TPA: hypothetical protein VLD84_09375 [Nitrososphaeraceae archaeon]|nr:hypothetical protein [Nitrososphaeraceae archaeon]
MQNLTLSESISLFRLRICTSFLKIIFSIAVIVFVSVVLVELFFVNAAFGIEPRSIYFSWEINISKNNGTSELPQVTAEGNNVYVVWQDNTNGNYDVYFAYSPDNGKNFESVRNLSKNNGTSELPQVTAEGNNVYVVWQDNTNGNYDVYFAYSPDNGRNFESVRNLSKNNGTSELPQVTAEGNNVYVVWQDNTNGNYDVYFKSSSTNGTNFKSMRNLSKNNGTSELPQISSTKDLFYVFWKDDVNGTTSAYFKEGRKEGSTTNTEFGPSRRILNSGNVSEPQLSVETNIYSSVWTSNSVNSSVIKLYPLTFFDDVTDAIQLTKSSLNEKIPSISIAGYDTGVYFVWESKKKSSSDIIFKRMSNFPDE